MNLATLAKSEAEEIEGLLTGVKVTADPRIASTQAGVLVVPPVHEYTRKLTTWTLVVLAGRDANDLRTFEVLAEIVEKIEDAGIVLEEATPGSYAVTNTQPPLPAYLLRYTTSN